MRNEACTAIRSVRQLIGALALPFVLALSACGGGGGGYGGGGNSMPAVNLGLDKTSITMGQSAVLTWSSMGATSCTASGAWSGAEPTSGTMNVTPTTTGTDTYTLTCAGTAKSVTLTVAAGTANGPYSLTSLVADTAGTSALKVDPNLVNPWGVSMAPGDAVWVANNGTQTSTLYDGNGNAESASGAKVVTLPSGAGNVAFNPTGIVANATTDFAVSANGSSGAALFIYAGTAGMLAGWAPTVNVTNAVAAYADTGGAVYKGLAIASNGGKNYLYAADFHNNKVDVFNGTYQKQTPTATSFSFTDPTLPAGYAPFGIQAINNGAGGATQIYVAYAQQAPPANVDNSFGAGLGLVDVFDTNGALLTHLIPVGGALNAPWGIALAPADFTPLSNDLLIANFGDGKINAYNPATGAFVAAVSDSTGNALAVPGLWGIAFGNDSYNQPHNTLFYAAGTDEQAHGSYGRIDVGATPPALNKAPVVAVTSPPPYSGGGYGGGGGSTLSGTVAVTATATDSVPITTVQFFANGASIGTAAASPYTVQWDTTKAANGTIALTATATDVNGNVGTSPTDSVYVLN